MQLLTDQLGSGYPLDYLAARLQCRLALSAAEPPENIRPATSAESPARDDFIDKEVKRKRFWLYTQMDESARGLLQPVYIHYEISSLFHHLRLRQGQEKMSKDFFADSVLPKKFIQSVWRCGTLFECMKVFERHFAQSIRPLENIAAFYASKGLAKTEERVIEALLQWGTGEKSTPTVRVAFAKFIDAYNCRKAAKWLRWDIEESCSFAPGGMLCPQRLRRLIREKNQGGLERYSHHADCNQIQQGGDWPVEEVVLASLRNRVRQQDKIAIVLFYFWSVAEQAKQWRREGRPTPATSHLFEGATA